MNWNAVLHTHEVEILESHGWNARAAMPARADTSLPPPPRDAAASRPPALAAPAGAVAPPFMKAAVLPDFGAPLEIRQVPVHGPAEGEVRVRVRAASVNAVDVLAHNGVQKSKLQIYPVTLGRDFAGYVDAIGSGVTGAARGDRVFGAVLLPRGGSFAEYVNVSRTSLAHLPDSVTVREGAALATAGTAAWRAVEAARLQRGEKVLVAGAKGGIRLLAIQLAAQAGAWVIASAHGDDARRLLSGLGAATIVDQHHDFGAQVLQQHPGGVDVVLHLAGATNDLLPLLRPGGRIISTVRSAPDRRPGSGVTWRTISAVPSPSILGDLADMLASGRMCVPIQRTYGLDETAAALHDFPHSKRGKLVLLMD